MTNEELFEEIDNITEYLFHTIEQIRFDKKETEFLSIARVKEVVEVTDVLEEIENNIDDYDALLKIIVTEDTVIYPDEIKEIKTNITDIPFNDNYDIIVNGFVPQLIFSKEEENNELKVKVKSKKQLDENLRTGYSYGDPYKLEKSKSGIYEIKQGSLIGFAIKRKNINEKEDSFVRVLK